MSYKMNSYFYNKTMMIFLSKYSKKLINRGIDFQNLCFKRSFNQIVQKNTLKSCIILYSE